jgi:hypothetical protein
MKSWSDTIVLEDEDEEGVTFRILPTDVVHGVLSKIDLPDLGKISNHFSNKTSSGRFFQTCSTHKNYSYSLGLWKYLLQSRYAYVPPDGWLLDRTKGQFMVLVCF